MQNQIQSIMKRALLVARPLLLAATTQRVNAKVPDFGVDSETHRGDRWIDFLSMLANKLRYAFARRFLALSPLPIANQHSTRPRRNFDLRGDRVMPQAYWHNFGKMPTQTVDWMDCEWRNWPNSLTNSDRMPLRHSLQSTKFPGPMVSNSTGTVVIAGAMKFRFVS